MLNAAKIRKVTLFTFALAISLSAFAIFSTNKAEARHDQALLQCHIRINKTACVKAVNECPDNNHACAERVPENLSISGTRVMEACRTVSDPQKCQTAVVKDCGGKPPAELAACRTTTISKLFSPNPTPSGSGVAVGGSLAPAGAAKQYTCGSGTDAVKTRFDLGCKGKGSAISDMLFAFVKFLTIGIGLIIVTSIILAGIQYATSGGSAEETAKAKDRIMQSMVALIFFLLISALAQYLVPGGIF